MAIDISTIKKGDKVYYQPKHYKPDGEFENGIIKEVPDNSLQYVRIVFNSNNDWENYNKYTSHLTDVDDLYLGWK